jgi:hypothetical protein
MAALINRKENLNLCAARVHNPMLISISELRETGIALLTAAV